MANYPNYTQLVGTRKEKLGGEVVERAVSGKPRIRSFYNRTRHVFMVEHEMDGPDKDILEAHYESHRLGDPFSFLFRGDNVTYSVAYANAIVCASIPGNDRWRVSNVLVEV